ncbi:hypothetical protein MRB53_032019 [Persea americana]|uniref:Uncharacterized protein n=1 Tax=Persea americana TaxID=3435 RepID=A0ACC2KQQ0_PERAE|nr:hypothetical protein MRB53_032019 [Persea americana]
MKDGRRQRSTSDERRQRLRGEAPGTAAAAMVGALEFTAITIFPHAVELEELRFLVWKCIWIDQLKRSEIGYVCGFDRFEICYS